MKRRFAAPALVAVATLAGCSMFRLDEPPERVAEMLGPGWMGGMCDVQARDAVRVARTELPTGGTAEFWIVPLVNGQGNAHLILEMDQADGNGGSTGCGQSDDPGRGIVIFGSMSTGDDTGTLYSIMPGRATPEADQVRVTPEDDEPFVAEIGVTGYFLIADDSDLERATLETLDGDGNVIATYPED